MSSQVISHQEFVEGTLIPGIRKMQSQNMPYLSFVVLGISIETLESYFDANLRDEGNSKERFKTAINKLFKPINKEYDQECLCTGNRHNRYCLYRGLRCAMAHTGRPFAGIAFTSSKQASKEGNAHLVKNSAEHLVLVAEDLADDFELAWKKLKELSEEGKTKKRVSDGFLTEHL